MIEPIPEQPIPEQQSEGHVSRPVGQLADRQADPLTDAVRALSRLSRLIERASDSLSPADYRVMSAIVGGEARASRLASRLLLGKPTISSTVDSLSRRGLIVKSGVEGDNRAIELSLSPAGAELFAAMEARMTRQLELLAQRTPDGDGVIRSLGWLGVVIEESMAARARDAVDRGEVVA